MTQQVVLGWFRVSVESSRPPFPWLQAYLKNPYVLMYTLCAYIKYNVNQWAGEPDSSIRSQAVDPADNG